LFVWGLFSWFIAYGWKVMMKLADIDKVSAKKWHTSSIILIYSKKIGPNYGLRASVTSQSLTSFL